MAHRRADRTEKDRKDGKELVLEHFGGAYTHTKLYYLFIIGCITAHYSTRETAAHACF